MSSISRPITTSDLLSKLLKQGRGGSVDGAYHYAYSTAF
jgi:hypothetical protein